MGRFASKRLLLLFGIVVATLGIVAQAQGVRRTTKLPDSRTSVKAGGRHRATRHAQSLAPGTVVAHNCLQLGAVSDHRTAACAWIVYAGSDSSGPIYYGEAWGIDPWDFPDDAPYSYTYGYASEGPGYQKDFEGSCTGGAARSQSFAGCNTAATPHHCLPGYTFYMNAQANWVDPISGSGVQYTGTAKYVC